MHKSIDIAVPGYLGMAGTCTLCSFKDNDTPIKSLQALLSLCTSLVCAKDHVELFVLCYLEPLYHWDHCQGRIQEVADRGAQWDINFSALEHSWRMAPSPPPPPTAVNLAPLKFSSLEPAPACVWRAPYSSCWFILFFLFSLFFLSFYFPFLSFFFFFFFFGAPLVTPDTPLLTARSTVVWVWHGNLLQWTIYYRVKLIFRQLSC